MYLNNKTVADLIEPSLVLSIHLLLAVTYSLSRSQVVLKSIPAVPEREEYTLDKSPVNHTHHPLTHSSKCREQRQWEETGKNLGGDRKKIPSDPPVHRVNRGVTS